MEEDKTAMPTLKKNSGEGGHRSRIKGEGSSKEKNKRGGRSKP
jgi:hypothetical protein